MSASDQPADSRADPDERHSDVDPAELRRLLFAEHADWHALTTDPLTEPALARAAQILKRTVEGLLADAHRAGSDAR